MTVLFVTLGAPSPSGPEAKIRDYHLIRHAARDHTVMVLSLLRTADEAAHLEGLKPYCDLVDYVAAAPPPFWQHGWRLTKHAAAGRPLAAYPYYTDAMARKIREVMANHAVNVVQVGHPLLAPYLDAVPEDAGCKTALSFPRPSARRRTALRKWEAECARHVDLSVVSTYAERTLLHRTTSTLQVSVVPEGLDTGGYPMLAEATGNRLLFAGAMTCRANVEAIVHFCNTTLPLIERQVADVELMIAAQNPPAHVRRLAKRANVTLATAVQDVLACYQRARVCLFPHQTAGASPVPLLEAFALGRPAVSTTPGLAELDVVDGAHVLVADDAAMFADGVVRLLSDGDLRARLTGHARCLMETRYDWSILGRRLLTSYWCLRKRVPQEAPSLLPDLVSAVG